MKKYIYLDRKKAKEGITLVYKVSETKIENYKEYFEGNAVEFYGEDIPHFITYLEETDSIREATEEEKITRGNRVLFSGEVLINGTVVSYNTYSQKVVDGKIIDKTRQDFIGEGILTLESEKEKARIQREKEFLAYHKLISNYNAGVVDLPTDEMNNIILWRAVWLNIPNDYIDLNIPIEENYPETPERINYYI